MTRILVVDDSRMARVIVKRALVAAGHADAEFVEADNGAQALARAREEPFDLIVTDLYMDRMSGLDMVRDLRGTGCEVPVCMVTSERSPEILAEARAAGVNWLLSKPFRAVELRELLSA